MTEDGGGKAGDCGYEWGHGEPNEETQSNGNEITAEWARRTAETQLGIKSTEELKKCFDAIKKAVSENKMSTTLYFYASKPCLEELHERGFQAYAKSDQREGSWTTISW